MLLSRRWAIPTSTRIARQATGGTRSRTKSQIDFRIRGKAVATPLPRAGQLAGALAPDLGLGAVSGMAGPMTLGVLTASQASYDEAYDAAKAEGLSDEEADSLEAGPCSSAEP